MSSAVRCFKSELLDPNQIERLIETRSLSETIGVLTVGRVTSAGASDLASFEAHLIGRVFPLAKRLSSYAPTDSRPLLKLTSAKYEFECVKEVLKSIICQADAEDAMKRIVPAGRFTAERCKELIEAHDINRVIGTLEDKAKRFISLKLREEKDIVTVVSAVDQYYYSRLWAAASNLLDLLDVQVARNLVGGLIDHLNIVLALRARLMGLDAGPTSRLLLPVNYRLNRTFNELAEAASLQDTMRLLEKTPYAHALEAKNIGSNCANLAEVEISLSRSHLATCLSIFAGSPFHIGLALAFLIIKNYELHDLLTILNAKANNLTSDRITSCLILKTP